MGMLSQAVSLAGGTFGRFAEFLGGPWGIALTLATVLLAKFAMDHREAGDAVEDATEKLRKHAQQIDINEQAQRVFDRTVEGSIAAMKKLTDEIDKQNLTLEDNIALKKAAIAGTLTDVVGNIGQVSAQLAQAVLAYREAQRVLADIQSGKLAVGENPTGAILAQQSRLADAHQQVLNLTAQLAGLNAAAEAGSRGLRAVDFPLVEQRAKDTQDAISTINHRFDEMAAKAKQAGTYTQQFADNLEKQRKAALDAAHATERASKSAGEYGRTVNFADAASIAKGAGLTVTSAYRSTAHQADLYNDPNVNRPGNPVARPGTSAHEGVNGKWALDIAFAPGLTAESLKKLYGGEGVSLTAIYKEKGHFHIEGNRTQAEIAADRSAISAQRARDTAWDKFVAGGQRAADAEVKLTEIGKDQVNQAEEYYQTHQRLKDLIDGGIIPSVKDWESEYDQLIAAQKEFNDFGGHVVDELLNPDNWKNWGDTAMNVLHEVLAEIIQLGAANPLKNLLFHQNNPTLGGLFSLFGGGKGISAPSGGIVPFSTLDTSVLPHMARGGLIGGAGGTDGNLLSINGIPASDGRRQRDPCGDAQ
jgi:hypothetical protein